ncbi:MAG: sensor histidine kinase [Deltaproteobacteria bacterium]|nr:sensor histidine kinase [Deltaproteobacteria bacterium]
MRTLKSKLALLLVTSALLPLVLFGSVSLYNFQKSLRGSIEESYGEITYRMAEQIALYLNHARSLLETLSQDLRDTGLSLEQSKRIVENYVIRFPEFLKILYYDQNLKPIFTTNIRQDDTESPSPELLEELKENQKFIFSKPYLSDELTPAAWFLLPLGTGENFSGVLVAKIDLMQMWQWISGTHLGQQGHISVINEEGNIIASGDPEYKKLLLSQDNPVPHPAGQLTGLDKKPQVVKIDNQDYLISVQKILDLPLWYLVLSQPTSEAFAKVYATRYALILLVVLMLVLMLTVAGVGARRMLLAPMSKLIQAIQALGKGDLAYRIKGLGKDEFGQLGHSFNQMAQEVSDLQETTRRQERMAMFGRMASGLAHDLKHPVKNIESAAQLMESQHNDAEYRATFTRIVKREFSRINQFLEDLRNLTHEMPFHPSEFDLKVLVTEIFESFQHQAREIGAELRFNTSFQEIKVEADHKLLRRVIENLVSNALQALPEGQVWVEIALEVTGEEISLKVRDNGKGIPVERLPGLFDEFTTTKRKGLGLGLAISKKILNLHGGSIGVQSSVGQGTCFELRFPRWQKSRLGEAA